MTHGFAWRVFLVSCVGLLSFALAHAHIDVRGTKTIERPTVINRNEDPPDGKITRAECARLKGRTLQEVIYQYGLPADFDRTDAYFDTLFYLLRGATGEQNCTISFDGPGLSTDKVDRVSIDV